MSANQMIEARIKESLGNDFSLFTEIAPYLAFAFVFVLIILIALNLNKVIIGIASLIARFSSK